VGIRNDKEWRTMLDLLLARVDRLVVSVPPSVPAAQRWTWSDVAAWSDAKAARGRPVDMVFEPDFDRALGLAPQGAETVIVTGSFHTVGDALARLPAFAPVG
jgi:dihydrofolate synthase/folylpolyglutamate synthase